MVNLRSSSIFGSTFIILEASVFQNVGLERCDSGTDLSETGQLWGLRTLGKSFRGLPINLILTAYKRDF